MRDCKKNQITMHYALYSDKIPILDDNGDETFEYRKGYFSPVEFKASLSAGKSTSEETPFGNDVGYDRIISTTDKSLPIDENARIWVDNEITYNQDGSVDGESADYKVSARPLSGLDSIRIAVKRVSKSST